MSVKKRKGAKGRAIWYYIFDAPGSTRANRKQIKKEGFATKQEAELAEAARRLEVDKQYEEAKKRQGKPDTLRRLLAAFVEDRARKLAPKTVERYREQIAYVSDKIADMTLTAITPMTLDAEWDRLLKQGGHKRGTGEPRPLSAKTVRNIAGVVSAAYGRAIHWGLCEFNPVTKSEPPIPAKRKGIALTPAQQDLLIESATSPWCLGTFLQMCAATGSRRGEVLALRWSDVQDGRVFISRSLSQTDDGLVFKATKSEEPRTVTLPKSMLSVLEMHRSIQDAFRAQFGPDYEPGDLIFATPEGKPLNPDSISSSVSQLCRRLKLPKGVSLHTLRHSHGSQLLAAGVDLATISERLGHSDVRVTAAVYTHAIRGRDDRAAQAWDQFQKDSNTKGAVKQ